MKVRLLRTYGDGRFVEEEWIKPEPTDDEIEVKAVMTGVCRSDIDMMSGKFPVLPEHMSGHEGLGIVTKIGKNVDPFISKVKIGDFVATRGEPAYADYYNCRVNEFVVVEELDPKYILEPVACGINCVNQAYNEFEYREDGKCLILGSGFLAWTVFNSLRHHFNNLQVEALGSNNIDLWRNKLLLGTSDRYDIVVDLSGKYGLGTDISLNNEALIIDAVGKAVLKEEAQEQLWKAVTTIKPSPRTSKFIHSMYQARWMIANGELEVDSFWTKCYNRNTEWQQAFEDGLNRPQGYSRGYIKWD